MEYILLFQGRPGIKVINGAEKRATPFVGADRKGPLSKMGLGLLFEDGTSVFWGRLVPHKTLQMWRAMKLLEHVNAFDDYVLSDCYYAAQKDANRKEADKLERLMTKFGSWQRFDQIRGGILKTYPKRLIMINALTVALNNDIQFDTTELEKAVTAGKMERFPQIQIMRLRDIQEGERILAEQVERDTPIERAESPGELFADLGFGDFIEMEPGGNRVFSPLQLDFIAKGYVVGLNGVNFPLLVKNPGTDRIQPPSLFVARSKVTFTQLVWRDGAFGITTVFSTDDDEKTEVKSVKELRRALSKPYRKWRSDFRRWTTKYLHIG